MKLQFWGAAGQVTGSRTLVRSSNKKYLVDCGLFQGPKDVRIKNWADFSEDPKTIEAVVLTHAHLDHSGYLPRLVKQGFVGPIYCSSGTFDLCKILLMDAARLQMEDAHYANRTGYSNHKPALPLFDENDARVALKLFVVRERDQWFDLGPELTVRLTRSGHIIGSSFVELNYSNGMKNRTVLFSGDLGNGRSPLLRPPVVPAQADELVLEATYGDRLQPRSSPLDDLAPIINRVVSRKGVLVIPAFSVGRSQEVLFYLQTLCDQKRIPHVPVFLDSPMSNEATQVFLQHEEDHQFSQTGNGFTSLIRSDSYQCVTSTDESMLLCMRDGPLIVISAAGMLSGGRILHHVKHRISDSKNAILFIGYQAQGSKGRFLLTHPPSIRIHHEEHAVEADVLSIESLSAHADYQDSIDWIERFHQIPKKIYLNHGEPPALKALQEKLKAEFKSEVIVVEEGALYSL